VQGVRLWHKELIQVLPKQQLLGQWRECCAIARNISKKGTPNHLLVNAIINYPISEFASYSLEIAREMHKRGFKCDWDKFEKYIGKWTYCQIISVFRGWHNDRYLRQCYYNLQEKYDCGGISDEEWKRIENWKESRERC